MGQSVLSADKKPLTKEESAKIIEAAIRKAAKKPTGELTKADYEKVRRLFLRSNQLTEAPKGLEKLPQLKQLHLEYNQLTDVTGLEKLTQLTSLNLTNNKLTDVRGLEKFTKLGVLWLENNPNLTKAQINELQKALPKCKIYSNPPLTKEESAKVIEVAIREAAKKPTGKLTKEDYEKVTTLAFYSQQLTDVKGLEKLTNLTVLDIRYNYYLTKAQIAKLQKALPKCDILHSAQ